jgi:hypothetical protein
MLEPKFVKPYQAREKGSSASLGSMASLQRTRKYASARPFSRASQLNLFDEPDLRRFKNSSVESQFHPSQTKDEKQNLFGHFRFHLSDLG